MDKSWNGIEEDIELPKVVSEKKRGEKESSRRKLIASIEPIVSYVDSADSLLGSGCEGDAAEHLRKLGLAHDGELLLGRLCRIGVAECVGDRDKAVWISTLISSTADG